MAIFRCENAAKRFLFSKSLWKTRKKNVMENFFLGHMGVKYGVKTRPIQKSTISPKLIDQKWSKIVRIGYFSSGKGSKWWELDSLHDSDKKEFVTIWSSSWGCKLDSHDTPTLGFSSAQKPLNHIMRYTFLCWGRLVLT
jgi:hypothetical protein